MPEVAHVLHVQRDHWQALVGRRAGMMLSTWALGFLRTLPRRIMCKLGSRIMEMHVVSQSLMAFERYMERPVALDLL